MDVPNGYDSTHDMHDDSEFAVQGNATSRSDEMVDDNSEERTSETHWETSSDVVSNGSMEVESASVDYDSDVMTEIESPDSDSEDWREYDTVRSGSEMRFLLDATVGGNSECDLNVDQYPSAQDLDADLACMLPAGTQVQETNERATQLQELQQFLEGPNNIRYYPQRRSYYQPCRPLHPYTPYTSSHSHRATDARGSKSNLHIRTLRLLLLFIGVGTLLLIRHGNMYAFIADCCSSLLLEVISVTLLLALLILLGRL